LVEEYEAWEIVRAGPLRLIEARVVGLDLPAALEIARAREMDVGVLAELLMAADAGLVAALAAAEQA
jgi:hypothetical protein